MFWYLFTLISILQLETEYSALVDLYNATNGAKWTVRSGTPRDCSLWYGVVFVEGRIKELNLFGMNLNGMIPDSIGNLTQLLVLDMSQNQLFGPLPTTIGKLARLERLVISVNKLNGTIPSSFGNLVNLVTLDLRINALVSPIPVSIGNLSKLKYLALGSNQFTGLIPDFFNKMKLVALQLTANQFSGPIPPSLSAAVNLSLLELDYNLLNGTVPAFISNFSQLNRLALSNNFFTSIFSVYPVWISTMFFCFLNNNPFSICPLPAWTVAYKCGAVCAVTTTSPLTTTVAPISGCSGILLNNL